MIQDDAYTLGPTGNRQAVAEEDGATRAWEYDALYLRARWMDSTTGRFLSRDPHSAPLRRPPALHRFSYAENDPVSRVDPAGLFSVVVANASLAAQLSPLFFSAAGAGAKKRSERPLTPGEVALAMTIFGGSVDYPRVRIVHGAFGGVFQFRNRPMSPNGKIYYHPKATKHWAMYSPDFSLSAFGQQGTFIHEMTHVWQWQHGALDIIRGIFQRRYDYGTLTLATDFSALEIEQQAQVAEDFFYVSKGALVWGAPATIVFQEVVPWKPVCICSL